VFLQLLLVPNLHDKRSGHRTESGNHCSKLAIDLRHDVIDLSDVCFFLALVLYRSFLYLDENAIR
jgi:hypothetical protein